MKVDLKGHPLMLDAWITKSYYCRSFIIFDNKLASLGLLIKLLLSYNSTLVGTFWWSIFVIVSLSVHAIVTWEYLFQKWLKKFPMFCAFWVILALFDLFCPFLKKLYPCLHSLEYTLVTDNFSCFGRERKNSFNIMDIKLYLFRVDK